MVYIERLIAPKPMGLSPPHMHITRYAYLSTVAWRRFHRHSMLCFRVIPSQRQLVKSHFISHPSLPRHNSPENRVSGARRATPQDSSQVFHKTACVAPSSSVGCPGQHEPGQFSRLSRSTSSEMTSFRTVVAHAHSETNISGINPATTDDDYSR